MVDGTSGVEGRLRGVAGKAPGAPGRCRPQEFLRLPNEGRVQGGGVRVAALRAHPAQSCLWCVHCTGLPHRRTGPPGLYWTFATALSCRPRRRASGAFEGRSDPCLIAHTRALRASWVPSAREAQARWQASRPHRTCPLSPRITGTLDGDRRRAGGPPCQSPLGTIILMRSAI